jgi:hypothetical protein
MESPALEPGFFILTKQGQIAHVIDLQFGRELR